jgi:hypothetical protein
VTLHVTFRAPRAATPRPLSARLVYGDRMKPAVFWLVCGLVLGCGGSRGTSGAAPVADTPAYEIHEWGVITTSRVGTDRVRRAARRAPCP